MTSTTTLPADAFVLAALDELITDTQNLLDAALLLKPRDADAKDEIAYWRKQVNALNKAAYHWSSGVRPTRSGDAWLMPSASRGGSLIHRLIQRGGVLICGCEAGQRSLLCWHHMLINVIDRAREMAGREEEEEEDPRPAIIAERVEATNIFLAEARASLVRRLCDARSRYDYAA